MQKRMVLMFLMVLQGIADATRRAKKAELEQLKQEVRGLALQYARMLWRRFIDFGVPLVQHENKDKVAVEKQNAEKYKRVSG
jgi:intein-encoded DNA endonuclease-like protein